MTLNTKDELIRQLDEYWPIVRTRFDGITDDEYLWEPVDGCWNLRPRAEATTAMAAGSGDTVADFELPEPDPAPVTTIAWRMGHLSIGIFGMRAANHFGDGGVDYHTTDWPLTARGGLDLLDHHYDAWMAGLRRLDPTDLERACGASEGPFAEYSFEALILHINRETIHHSAEIGLLRDLYRRTSPDGMLVNSRGERSMA